MSMKISCHHDRTNAEVRPVARGHLSTVTDFFGSAPRTCGYPERFAQAALGRNSKAVHRAYARKAQLVVPTLEDYDRKPVATAQGLIVPMPAAVA
jgi:hypothetical protein